MIPAEHAQIHWNERDVDGHDRVDEVLVFDRRTGVPDEGDYDNSRGACDLLEWLKGDPRSTPAGIYAMWRAEGFVDPEAEEEALLKLSEIEGCEWARTLAEAMRIYRKTEWIDT